jgi:disulfide bond formation protein DsbB
MPWAALALLVSAIGVAGTLYLSIGMGLRACPLCFYQRTFVMGAFAVLLFGLVVDRRRAGLACLLALPLVFGGLGVAAFHWQRVLAGKMECPLGVFELGTAPAQSLAMFVLLALATAMGVGAGRRDFSGSAVLAGWGAVILGLVLAWACVKSSPPPAPSPAPQPGERLLTCRPIG